MSSLKCLDCGLINPSTQNKCIACFQYDADRFWQCGGCDLINKVTNTKCLACFTCNKAKFDEDNQWKIKYLSPSPTTDSPIKMVEWENKLYTVVLCPQSVEQKETSKMSQVFDIKMIDHSTSEINHKPTKALSSDILPGIETLDMTLCVNRKEAELYMIVFYREHTKWLYQCMLFIYDLDKQKVKKQQQLKFDAKYNFIEIKRAHLICSHDSNNSHEFTLDMINNWNRNSFGKLTIPSEIYMLIHKFYSMRGNPNYLHVSMYGKSSGIDNEYYENDWTLIHGIIDLNNIDLHCLEFTDKHIVASQSILSNNTPDLISLVIRNNDELLWPFKEYLYRVDLHDVTIQKEWYLSSLFGASFQNRYYNKARLEWRRVIMDNCDNMNRQYSFYLIHYHGNGCNLLCFDVVKQEFFTVAEDVFEKYEDRAVDLKFFNGYLYFAFGARSGYNVGIDNFYRFAKMKINL